MELAKVGGMKIDWIENGDRVEEAMAMSGGSASAQEVDPSKGATRQPSQRNAGLIELSPNHSDWSAVAIEGGSDECQLSIFSK